MPKRVHVKGYQLRLPLVATLRGSRYLRGGGKMAPQTGHVARQTPTGRGLMLTAIRMTQHDFNTVSVNQITIIIA